ncbi:MAG: M14 family zinc carboxypeptidase [Solirubrobacteraceae bacterium]
MMLPSRVVILALALAATAGGAAAITGFAPGRAGSHAPAAARIDTAGRGGATAARTVVFGHSVRGRALVARERGGPGTARRVLVVGCIHGNECAGQAVTRRLAALGVAAGADLWLVDNANPDGTALRRRQNAHGVDLNRNFPYRWRQLDHPGGSYWSGPRPLSEPESRALRRLILRLRPDVTIWYHQHMRLVDQSGGDAAVERRYAGLVGLPLRRLARFPGSVSSWQDRYLSGSTAFVVELPAGRLAPSAVTRHAAAVLALAGASSRRPAAAAITTPPTRAPPSLRPPIRQWRIPFTNRRRAEMAAYARRHYGVSTWRLVMPKVIVEHYSDTSTASAVYNTFAPDRPDPELHELPGTCAHFVVSPQGTIFQLVDLGTMCRHALGLNYIAIGIEHAGFSDGQVMGNPRELAASLRLTRWLRCLYGIQVRNVIGHAEALSSPYHRERIARLRNQTHGDFARPAMTRYRARLARLPCR